MCRGSGALQTAPTPSTPTATGISNTRGGPAWPVWGAAGSRYRETGGVPLGQDGMAAGHRTVRLGPGTPEPRGTPPPRVPRLVSPTDPGLNSQIFPRVGIWPAVGRAR